MHINLCNKKTSAKYVPSDTFYALESMKRFLSLQTHFFFFFNTRSQHRVNAA